MIVSIGTMLANRYEIIEKVGTGGMANVYRAKDHRLNRFVAVKILKNEFSEDTKFVTKFQQEAQAIACITHPNIVAVYDVGEDKDMHYIVMEFVEGITLKKYIEKKGKLSVREAVGVALQIANGLEAAHDNHIIHRDIKPQNILISQDGTAKVTDFGIAKAASSNTITANAMGSVHYISPEQARGGFSDEKSDIYSLGVTLYEMLSGTLPFSGESAVAVALAHIQEDATPLIGIDATIPKGLSDIVNKCMQKKTEFRYPTAADLIADMKMFLQDPTGNYGVISPLYENTDTIFIQKNDAESLKAAAKASSDEFDDTQEIPDEEDTKDVDPKLEKALIIGSIAVAIIIGAIIIFMLGKFIGLWGGTDTSSVGATQAPQTSQGASTTQAPAEGQTNIPNIAGMNKESADSMLKEANLVGVFEQKESDTVPEGKVIGTSPEIGSTVAKDSEVTVYISSGKRKIQIPSVTGNTEEEARTTLEDAGFKVKIGADVYSDSVPENQVAYTNPKAGAKALPNSTVTIYVSKGKEDTTVSVPDLIGKTKSKAKSLITSKGLVVGSVTSQYSDNIEKGYVMMQSPASGTKVEKGTTINITISLGSQTTYSYYNSESLAIDSPFDYDTDSAATFKFVLTQGGKTTTWRKVTLSPNQFPYKIGAGEIKGNNGDEGQITVYKDGAEVASYTVNFKKVAD